ncbi:MAG: DNA translocase FtsK 4TM domain-containing protein, partial [Burkholderiales bacterium]|nr:DNA translocase FtsK 4TM domain-containing protein [Burkholderiales bacterium]
MARVLKAGPALGRGGSAGAVGATASVGSLLPERLVVLLRESRWLVQCCLAVFLALILLSYHPTDPGWSHAIGGRSIQNLGGRLGAWFADLLLYLFGMTAWLWAAFLMLRVVSGYRQLHPGSVADRAAALDAPRFGWDRWLGFALLFAGCVMLEASRMPGLSGRLPFAPGGVVGHGLSVPLLEQLGSVGGTLAMLMLSAIGFSLATGVSWLTIFEKVGATLEGAVLRVVNTLETRHDRREGERAASVRKETVEVKRRILTDDPEPVRIEPPVAPAQPSERAQRERQKPLFTDLPADTELPPLSLLDPPPEVRDTVAPETLEYTSRLIEKKLSDFGVTANVVAAYPGPVITRYEIEPATGVKGSQIV